MSETATLAVSPPQRQWRWGVVGVLLVTALIRWHRLDVPMERDEGEYAYAGQLMLQGTPPYVLAYNMKLPGIYLVYAIFEAIFGDTLRGIHGGLLVVNLASILLVFQVGRKLLDERAAFFSSAIFALLSSHWSVTGLFANSEHFVVLPVLAGTYFLITALQQGSLGRWGMAGLLMGTGFVIKQHGILFVAFGGAAILAEGLRTRPIPYRATIQRVLIYCAGTAVPFAAICIWMAAAGVFSRFWFWTFVYSPHYVAQIPLKVGWLLLTTQLSHMTGGELSPIWLLTGLGCLATVIDPEVRRQRYVWWLWMAFSGLSVCPGLYFRGHYFLFVLPVCSLLVGAAVTMLSRPRDDGQSRLPMEWIVGALILFAVVQQRHFLLQFTNDEVVRNTFGDNAFAESPVIGDYIQKNSSPADTVAVIGSEPQVYFYARRRSATGYIYMYPLQEKHPFCQEMQREMIQQIETAKPRFVVYFNVADSWLRGREPYTDLREWYPGYLEKHYELTGLIELRDDAAASYRWDAEVQDATLPDTKNSWVSVYRRKIDSP